MVSRVVVVLSVRRARASLSSCVLPPPIDRPDATVERCFISAAFFLLHLKVFQVLLWTVVGFFTPVLCFSRKVRLFVTCTMDIVSEPFPLLSWFGFPFSTRLLYVCMYLCMFLGFFPFPSLLGAEVKFAENVAQGM